MKTILLSIPQRLQLVAFLNGFQGKSYDVLVQVWKLIEKCSIGEDEKKTIGLRVEGNQVIWDATKAKDSKIEFSSDEEKVFLDEFDAQSKANKLDVSQYNLAQVYIKLKDVKKDENGTEISGL